MGLLVVHKKTQHGKAAGGRRHWVTTNPRGDTLTYKMDFPTAGGPSNCPVEGCQGRAATRTAIRVNFLHRHVRDTVIILEDVNLHHPR